MKITHQDKIIDKRDVLRNVGLQSRSMIELGVGKCKRNRDAIEIDIIDYDSGYILGDASGVLRNIPNESVDSVFSEHGFEHLPDIELSLQEITRVLVPGGKLTVIGPHHSNPVFYSDPTHRNFFGLYIFSYYCWGGKPSGARYQSMLDQVI